MQRDQETDSILDEKIQKVCFSFVETYCIKTQITPK